MKKTVTIELLRDKHCPDVLAIAIDGIRITPSKATGSWHTAREWTRIRVSDLLDAVGAYGGEPEDWRHHEQG
jgi:hypothetical protein